MNIDYSRQQRTPVLVVGAGPTGLMMANQLARFGIPFRIIEKNEGPTSQSRALVIQPRSLEILEQMGIARRASSRVAPPTGTSHAINGGGRVVPERPTAGSGLSSQSVTLKT